MQISIILPCYNVEKYLKQCIESVLNQSYINLQIILINDGSTDNSKLIIDEYHHKDERILVYHQTNKGYGSAINKGLELATGDYIAIVETDDWIESEMIETLVQGIDHDIDIVKGNFRKIYSNKQPHVMTFCDLAKNDVIHGTKPIELMIYESSIWTAIYKRSFLIENNISMPETKGASYQDIVWKFMVYSCSKSIKLIDKPLYNYRVITPGSSSSNKNLVHAPFHNYNLIESFLKTNCLLKEYYDALCLHAIYDFVFHLNRLSKENFLEFKYLAFSFIDKIYSSKFDINTITLLSDYIPYFENHVLPTFYKLMIDKSIHEKNYIQLINNSILFIRYSLKRVKYIIS